MGRNLDQTSCLRVQSERQSCEKISKGSSYIFLPRSNRLVALSLQLYTLILQMFPLCGICRFKKKWLGTTHLQHTSVACIHRGCDRIYWVNLVCSRPKRFLSIGVCLVGPEKSEGLMTEGPVQQEVHDGVSRASQSSQKKQAVLHLEEEEETETQHANCEERRTLSTKVTCVHLN